LTHIRKRKGRESGTTKTKHCRDPAPKARRCPKCRVSAGCTGAFGKCDAKGDPDISPYRRYHCHACMLIPGNGGFHFSIGDKEYPVWLIVALVLVGLYLARFIVSTDGVAWESRHRRESTPTRLFTTALEVYARAGLFVGPR